MNSIFNITLRQVPKTDDHEENFGENNDSILIDFNADNSASNSEETGNNNFNINNNTATSTVNNVTSSDTIVKDGDVTGNWNPSQYPYCRS